MSNSASTEARRILVVDDNPAIHEDFKKILHQPEATDLSDLKAQLFGESETTEEQLSFEIEDAYQGQEALEKLNAAIAEGNPFTVAFVDMRMPPGWDGMETIQHLWEADPSLQVVICSAYSDRQWTDVLRDFGVRDNLLILKKPFDNVEVLQLAQALSEKHRLTKMFESKIEDLGQLVDQLSAKSEANAAEG
ncbi:response regulator [Stieleria sp. JC731]|uniref:response regulator transcription factor n=1 Tax=Pirellulaceae TaxID=2691357 RepID=UPI001E528E3B|nr:response regulator [Stieleria sp. JC731]MCC9601688.1 response regulator [Stieleria sp. JC731]